MENGLIESFNGKLRDECLNTNWFTTLVREWRQKSAPERPYEQQRNAVSWFVALVLFVLAALLAIAGVTLGIAGFTGTVEASTYPYVLIGASLVAALGGLLLGR